MADTDASTSEAAAEGDTEQLPDSISEAIKAPVRKPEEVAAELDAARHSLVANVDAIQEYLTPANMIGRQNDRFRRIFVGDDGKPNVRNIAITAGVVILLLTYRIRRK